MRTYLVVAIVMSGTLLLAQAPETPSESQTPAPAGAGEIPNARISMQDGQLKSHSIRVYVTRDITPDQNPRLQLLRSHAVTKKAVDETAFIEPGVVAPGQEWSESVNGQQVRRTGTLLMFDLSNMDFGLRAMVRVMPVLSWTENGTSRLVVGAREVNVGSIVPAMLWTVLIVGLAVLIVVALALRATGRPLQFLTGVDGHLSLAQTQIACWTVVVGGIVLGYGLIKLEIPDIPTSLLALMGASLATGGIAFFQDAKKQNVAVDAGAPTPQFAPAWSDLVRVFPSGELSLSKAQMLFWTVLLLVLFISKSILDGGIWEVPWPLVALMGFSQAGYLAPKIASQP